ncbi:MAG: 50S ribosomal protein L29 [Proteobacteria bacterium]|nr:50S ribosomal protein L29 [Pseudomonadota bacterium]
MSKTQDALERIRDLPDEELDQALDRARDEYFRLTLQLHTNQVDNTMSVRAKRREVARILTVQRARALGLESQAQGTSAASDSSAEGKDE